MVSLSAKLPNPDMSNAEWQEYFKKMKTQVIPSKRKNMPVTQSPVYIYSYTEDSDERIYIGETEYSLYRTFINSILSTIRKRNDNIDYCFYIYQIAELLRFEPERLQTEYLPDCKSFRIWLNPN